MTCMNIDSKVVLSYILPLYDHPIVCDWAKMCRKQAKNLPLFAAIIAANRPKRQRQKAGEPPQTSLRLVETSTNLVEISTTSVETSTSSAETINLSSSIPIISFQHYLSLSIVIVYYLSLLSISTHLDPSLFFSIYLFPSVYLFLNLSMSTYRFPPLSFSVYLYQLS